MPTGEGMDGRLRVQHPSCTLPPYNHSSHATTRISRDIKNQQGHYPIRH